MSGSDRSVGDRREGIIRIEKGGMEQFIGRIQTTPFMCISCRVEEKLYTMYKKDFFLSPLKFPRLSFGKIFSAGRVNFFSELFRSGGCDK